MKKLKIYEMFRGCQGEGLHTGIPAVFVRLSGCNKRCVWKNGACDTKFASFQAVDYDELEINEIINEISALKCSTIIFTGGEPCLQVESLKMLIEELIELYDYKIFIETNGSIYDRELVELIGFWSISPKLTSSGNKTFEQDKKAVGKILRDLVLQKKDSQLKFVIDTTDIEKDMNDVRDLLNSLPHSKYNVVFQPEGLTEDLNEYAKRAAKLTEYLIYDNWFEWLNRFDWRVMMQNHRVMWNNERRK
ncbi:7-carboxy-7-deazaguanine synthase QueE [bacterium]|nr:7-carboxy-7-deazaguanine synthase QueE [bacterium]